MVLQQILKCIFFVSFSLEELDDFSDSSSDYEATMKSTKRKKGALPVFKVNGFIPSRWVELILHWYYNHYESQYCYVCYTYCHHNSFLHYSCKLMRKYHKCTFSYRAPILDHIKLKWYWLRFLPVQRSLIDINPQTLHLHFWNISCQICDFAWFVIESRQIIVKCLTVFMK